jgi:hypothetical protein
MCRIISVFMEASCFEEIGVRRHRSQHTSRQTVYVQRNIEARPGTIAAVEKQSLLHILSVYL